MKIFRRNLKGEILRYKKTITLTVNSEYEKHLSEDWEKIFSEILSNFEFFLDKEILIPNHLEFFLGQTYNLIQDKNKKINQLGKQEDTKDALSKDLLTIIEPKYTMSDIVLTQNVKTNLEELIFYCQNKDQIEKEIIPSHLRSHSVGIYINFYGPSGTGKTMAAEIIANVLNKKLLVVNYANLESEFVGRTSKNIHSIFNIANKDKYLLMFDEADSFLSSRITDLRQSADYGINTSRSQLLKELESYKGIVIFATNNVKNYDIAFHRRLHYNIHFPLPDFDARLKILKKQCFSNLISKKVNLEKIAKDIDGFSGGDIQNLVKRAIVRGMKDIKEGKSNKIEPIHFEHGINCVKFSQKAFGLISSKPIELVSENSTKITNEELLDKIK